MRGWTLSLVVLASILLIGAMACGPLPQTRAEFAIFGEAGRDAIVKETRIVQHPFERLVELMTDRTQRCLNIGFTLDGSPVSYRSTFEAQGEGRAELTVQRYTTGYAQQIPEGGPFVFTADLRSLGGGQISVVTHRYRYKAHQGLNATIDRWLQGEAVGCPEMP